MSRWRCPLNLTAKRWAIVGPQGCGKTVLAHFLARRFASAFVIDPLDEYGDLPEGTHSHYTPRNLHYSDDSNAEINRVVGKYITNGPYVRKVDLWLVDEANRYFPHAKPLPSRVGWLNDTIRHTGMSWGIVARRLVQLNVDLIELAHVLFLFRMTGKNDLAYADELSQGLGDIIKTLPPYHFVSRDPQGNIQVHSPTPLTE